MNLQVRPWVAALIDLAIEHGLEVKSSCHGEFMVELVILVMMATMELGAQICNCLAEAMACLIEID